VAGATVALGAEVTAACGVGTAVGAGSAGSAPGGRGAATHDRDEAVRILRSRNIVVAERPTQEAGLPQQRRLHGKPAASGPSRSRDSRPTIQPASVVPGRDFEADSNGHISPVSYRRSGATGEALARRPRRQAFVRRRSAASAGCRSPTLGRCVRRSLRQPTSAGSRPSRGGAGVSGGRGGERVGQPAGADRRGQTVSSHSALIAAASAGERRPVPDGQ